MISCLAQAKTDAEGQGPMLDVTFCFALKFPPQLLSAGEDVEALLGFSREEFLTARVQPQDRIHPADAGLAETLFSQNSTDIAGSVNLRIRHADGRIRCLKARFAKTHTCDGAPQLDLRLEDVRQLSEPGDAILIAGFKTLVENTDDYILLKNSNHVILAASRSLPSFTESAKQAAELVGKTDYDIHPEAIADAAYELESRAFAERRRMNEHQQLRTQDGALRWIDNRKYPINGPDGEIIGVLGIAPDITEHVEADGRVRESEELLRDAQKIGGLGSYSLDIQSGVWTSSEVLDEIFGIDRAYERTMNGWGDLLHPGDRAAMSTYFAHKVLGQGEPFDKEYRIVRRGDGAERWVHGRGELIFDSRGRPVTMHGIIQDITESKRKRRCARARKRSARRNASPAWAFTVRIPPRASGKPRTS